MNILWCLMSLRQFLEAHSFGGLPDFYRLLQNQMQLETPAAPGSELYTSLWQWKVLVQKKRSLMKLFKKRKGKANSQDVLRLPGLATSWWRFWNPRERDGPKRSQISRILQLFVVGQVRDWLLTTTCWLLPIGQIASGGQGHATHVARIGVADADDRIVEFAAVKTGGHPTLYILLVPFGG